MKNAKKRVEPNTKTGKLPSQKKLKQFIEKGGYEILEFIGTGSTPEEKHMNGWKKHGIMTRLKEETTLSKPTLYKIKEHYPTRKSTGSNVVRIKQEDFKQLEDMHSRLESIEKKLNRLKEYFERSLIVDLLELKARRELLGETIESQQIALKQQIDAGERERSDMETLLEDIDSELHKVWLDIHFIKSHAKRG